MFDDVELRIRKHNKILFTQDSECLQNLCMLISKQRHTTQVLWALECLQIPMEELARKYPDKEEITRAYELSNSWAHGEIKMPVAKKAILSCHALARDMDDPYDIALCHGIGQGCSTVHVGTHAMGLVYYELTAIVVSHDYQEYQREVLDKIQFYTEKLKWCIDYLENRENKIKWADFLVRDRSPVQKNCQNKTQKNTEKHRKIQNIDK